MPKRGAIRMILAACLPLFVLVRCDCDDPGGSECSFDTDCPDHMFCLDGQCVETADGQPGGDDGGRPGDDGQGPGDDGGVGFDYGDLGGIDGGQLFPCNDDDDCQAPEICYNNYCVIVVPDPDCIEGDDDECLNDTYCVPELEGCIDWDAQVFPGPDCEYIPPVGEFTPVEEWVWENPQVEPEWNEVMMTPVVVHLSGQSGGDVFDPPAVVFNSFNKAQGYSQNGILRALEGNTGNPIFNVTNPEHRTHPVSNIAVGNLDDDEMPEIVTGKSGGVDLICFEHDGTFKWATTSGQLTVGWGGPAIANVDGVGYPEVVMGAAVIDANGTVLWSKPGSSGTNSSVMGVKAPFSVPVDVNYDDKMEIVTGDVLYDHLGNEIWNTGNGDGFVAVANFYGDSDSPPEIVVVRLGTVRLQSSINGEILWYKEDELNALPECVPNCGLLGPPTIANFDDDDLPEIGIAGSDVYIVLDTTGDILWSIPARDSSSNITGSAVFDFEGDGKAEVVYADEISLKVLKGEGDGSGHGVVLYEQPHSSLTACEYPVIADVDADHNAEIIIAQNDLMEDAPHKFAGIRVFGDQQDNWVNTRTVWNQHAYYVTNINEDGEVPLLAQKNWQVAGLNNFRQNVQGEGLFDAPDLTVKGLGYDASNCMVAGIIIYAEVFNRGKQSVPPGLAVSFYLGDPRSGGQLLGTVHTVGVIYPGQSEPVAYIWTQPPVNTPVTIYVVADDTGWDPATNSPSGEHSECRENNNIGFIEDVTCVPPP